MATKTIKSVTAHSASQLLDEEREEQMALSEMTENELLEQDIESETDENVKVSKMKKAGGFQAQNATAIETKKEQEIRSYKLMEFPKSADTVVSRYDTFVPKQQVFASIYKPKDAEEYVLKMYGQMWYIDAKHYEHTDKVLFRTGNNVPKLDAEGNETDEVKNEYLPGIMLVSHESDREYLFVPKTNQLFEVR